MSGFDEAFLWLHELERRLPAAEVVREIKARLSNEPPGVVAKIFASRQAKLLCQIGQRALGREILEGLAEKYVDDIQSLVGLAEQELYFGENLEVALNYAKRAVAVASRTRTFRRQSLGVRARIELKLGRHDALQHTVRELMALKSDLKSVDCGMEADFVERAPVDAIDADLRKQYLAEVHNSR